jgi:hypothetical protein
MHVLVIAEVAYTGEGAALGPPTIRSLGPGVQLSICLMTNTEYKKEQIDERKWTVLHGTAKKTFACRPVGGHTLHRSLCRI